MGTPRIIKPDFDGYDLTDTGGSFYDGPPPKPGTYRGKIKQFNLARIEKEGENQGKKRLDLLIEITSTASGAKTPFVGAGLFHSINQTETSAPFLNQFLRALTDGSEEEFAEVREAWWRKGKRVGDVATIRGKKMVPVLQFGRWKPESGDLEVTFKTKMRTIEQGDRKGEEVAEIRTFLCPVVAEPEDDTSDGLDEFDGDTTSNPNPEGDAEDNEGFGDDEGASESSEDDGNDFGSESSEPQDTGRPPTTPAGQPASDPDDPWA